MKYFLSFFSFFAFLTAAAQAPVINNLQPLNAGPNQKIVITGNGFNATAASNSVWFDHVPGVVTASTIYSIEVQVPPQARFSNVEVINLANNLSSKSGLKFLPSYGGTQFDVTKTSLAFTNNDTNELFDIASADVDMDGKPDLVTSKGGPTTGASITDLYVYQNTTPAIGNITFTRTSVALTVGGPTANVACGDLNGDGKPDIVASRGGATRNEVFVLKNTNTVAGTLAFSNQAKLVLDPGEFAFRLSIRDMNGDGKPEVIVSNAHDDLDPTTDNKIYIFPNQSTLSTISFGSPVRLAVTGADSTYGLDVQDIDGDGKADIIVNQFQKQDIFLFRNTSTGNLTFDPVTRLTAAGNFLQITSSDLNNDGLLDLIATSIEASTNDIQIWINKSVPGTISFNASQVLQTSIGPWGVDVSDIDGDGDADIVVANKNGVGAGFDATDTKLNIFRQDSPLSFTRVDIVTTNPTRNLRIGDYDGDGKPDIAFSSFPVSGTQNTVNVIRNANCWNPVITGPSTTICTGQTIPLQTQPALGVTFSWAPQASATNTLGATASGTFMVTLTGTVDTGCINTSAGYMLTPDVNTFPTDPSISNNVPCLGGMLNLSTSSTADSYAWTGPNSFTSSSQNPTLNSITTQNAGVYTLQLKMNNGCSSNIISKTLDVASVPILPVVASPATTICAGASVTLSVTGSGYTFQWNKNGGAISGQTASSLSLTSVSSANEGDYSVTVTSIANTCSQETGKTTISVYAPPVAGFTFAPPLCKGIAVTFTDQTTFDNRGTLNYAWAFGDAGTSTIQNPTHTYATASSFSANLTVSYVGVTSCSNSVTKPIVINNATVPTIVATANPICVGDQTTLSINGTFSTIAWTGATGTNSSVVITQPGQYKVSTVDANGCTSKDSLTINLKPSISPFTATSSKPSINVGDTVKLIATAGADSYLWQPGKTLTDSTAATTVAKPQTTTLFIVLATKAGFCSVADSVTITVQAAGGAIIKPPVLFSPNFDTINDTWQIPEATNYPDWTMTIYDGHGSQIYQQKGYNSINAWDGTYNGKASPDGTYFYVFSNSKDKPSTGSVLVVR